jgi:hypothetical protein
MIFSRFPSVNKLFIFSQQSKLLIVEKWNNLRSREIDKNGKIRQNYEGNTSLGFGKLRGPYLFTSYQLAKFKDQINIGSGY